jgi:diguanylate cyclase (GGDEF)-like protein
MSTAKRRGQRVAVLCLSLNGVELVNDALGRRTGDLLIELLADRLRNAIREADVISRIGGIEFAFALGEINDFNQVIGTAQRILKMLSEECIVAGHPISLSGNVGAAIYPEHGDSPELLLANATVALREARDEKGNDLKLFEGSQKSKRKERIEMEWLLRKALDRKELSVVYQPQVSLATRQIITREALLRWEHPELGSISPSQFIPIAEETGLIIPIGNWVLHQACQCAQSWSVDHGTPVRVAVNVSTMQFSRPDFTDSVKATLRETGLDPARLELELTESAVVENFEMATAKILSLKRIGVKFLIDDFGSRYSVLNYLKELPVDGIKIDRSFLKDLGKNPAVLKLLRTIISLAEALNLRTVIEGVETQDQLRAVLELDVDQVQGFLFGQPARMPTAI